MQTPPDQQKALEHIASAEQLTSKLPDGDDKTLRPIQSVGVIGAGTMGSGIAMTFAKAGIPVALLELNEKALERGLNTIRINYERRVDKGRMSLKDMNGLLKLIQPTTNYDALSDVDLAVEAVFEDLEVKKTVFEELDTVCKESALLASNTSYQNIDEIAAVTRRPEDVLGLHFFSPAHIMKLLEVVRGEKTANDVIATAMTLAKTINKIPVLARVCYGFIGNRMFQPYLRTANMMLLEGATPEQVDKAATDFGMAMGPFAVSDLAGIDIGVSARRARGNKDPLAFLASELMYDAGRLGQKTGAGFYTYDRETREKKTDPHVLELIRSEAKERGISQRNFTDDDIVDRLVYSLVNEGANVLDDGVARRSSDIDITYVYGYGFPKHKGGPMYYADTVGLENVLERIHSFQIGIQAAYWQPSALLERLAKEGSTFQDFQTHENGNP